MEKKATIVIKIGENANVICSIPEKKIMSELRLIAIEKVSDMKEITQPIRIMDGNITDITKKDTILLVWNITDGIIGSFVDVYQTKEKLVTGWVYNSTQFHNELLFSIICVEYVDEVIQDQIQEQVQDQEQVQVQDQDQVQNIDIITEIQPESIPKEILEPQTLTFTEDDMKLFREKYETVLDDLKEQVKNLSEIVNKNYTLASQEEIKHEKKEIRKNKDKNLKGSVLGLDGVAHEISKFDRKKLKSRAERDRLLERKRHQCELLYIPDNRHYYDSEW